MALLKITNPSAVDILERNVNSHFITVRAGQTIEVAEADGLELLKFYGFLRNDGTVEVSSPEPVAEEPAEKPLDDEPADVPAEELAVEDTPKEEVSEVKPRARRTKHGS